MEYITIEKELAEHMLSTVEDYDEEFEHLGGAILELVFMYLNGCDDQEEPFKTFIKDLRAKLTFVENK